MRVHQYLTRVRLSRRRPTRGQLLHGTADRRGRRRDGHRSPGAAPAQPDQAARDSDQDGLRQQLRQRRLSGPAQARARSRRREGLRPPQTREPQARKGARARRRKLSRGNGAPEQGNGRHPVRSGRQRHRHHRHARLRARSRGAVRAGTQRKARHSFRAHPAPPRRQRRIARGRRHRRLEIDHAQRHRDRRSGCQGGRARQADRLARARSLTRRHRVRQWPLRHCRHRSRDRDHGARRAAARRTQAAGGHSLHARCAPRERGPRRLNLSQRMPRLRSRARPRDRRDRGGEIRLGQ